MSDSSLRTSIPKDLAWEIEYYERQIHQMRRLAERGSYKGAKSVERRHVRARLEIKCRAGARYFEKHPKKLKRPAQLITKFRLIDNKLTRDEGLPFTRKVLYEMNTVWKSIAPTHSAPAARMAVICIVLEDLLASELDPQKLAYMSPMVVPMIDWGEVIPSQDYEPIYNMFVSYPALRFITKSSKDTYRPVGQKRRKNEDTS